MELVNRVGAEIEIGKLYEGKVVSTTNFGAFMEVLPGKDGLIHISELADKRVDKTEDVCKVGDTVTAKCIGIDDKRRVKMSIKAALRDQKVKEGSEAPAEDKPAPSQKQSQTADIPDDEETFTLG
jgi:polyribonucleotide nucleotidyltransferase